MKKFVLLFVLMLSILSGCSGGNYRIESGTVSSNSYSISGQYQFFNGYFYKEVKLYAGDHITFHYECITGSGSLSTYLYHQNDQLLEITNKKTYIIQKTGIYQIKIIGKKHQGRIFVSWDVK